MLLTDNLWSTYVDKGVFVEKRDQPSIPVPDETKDLNLPYVYTDIMTYFTMLVGIYFPSVTGSISHTLHFLSLSQPHHILHFITPVSPLGTLIFTRIESCLFPISQANQSW